jgi:hypothetical protein
MDADVAAKHFTADEIANLPDLYFNAARSVSGNAGHAKCSGN